MKTCLREAVTEAKEAALKVLQHNVKGPYQGLPRTAGWGYPEPYTRDLMIAALGTLASGDNTLISALGRVLKTLAQNQTPRGHIPSLVHDPEDRGASDTTPLFILALAIFRQATGEEHFLDDALERAVTWMDYQSCSDRVIVSQQPTSDWRDEHWVLGFGLFVNTVVYAYLRLLQLDERANILRQHMGRFVIHADYQRRHVHEGLVVPHKPYYALWSYKLYDSERFDLLGNSLAILSGLAAPTRAKSIIAWVEDECAALRQAGLLAVDLPPCLFPYIKRGDPDWLPRYQRYNPPGDYHNGGVWPFICGFYVVAALAAGLPNIAEKKLEALTKLVKPARERDVTFGFNEWFRAQDGTPQGQDWQTWSAAMYLYAATCVERSVPLFFETCHPGQNHGD